MDRGEPREPGCPAAVSGERDLPPRAIRGLVERDVEPLGGQRRRPLRPFDEHRAARDRLLEAESREALPPSVR